MVLFVLYLMVGKTSDQSVRFWNVLAGMEMLRWKIVHLCLKTVIL